MVEIYINKRNITIRLTTTLQVLILLIVLIHVSVSGFDASVFIFRLVVAGGEQAALCRTGHGTNISVRAFHVSPLEFHCNFCLCVTMNSGGNH